MLKGIERRCGVASQAKPVLTIRPSALLTARAPPSKQRQPFKPARGSNLRAAAASADDAASEASVSAPAAARVARMPLSSLKPGAIYEGTVTKVDTFGAFVNFGAERDGLVHISQLSDKFVESAAALVAKGDVVRVRLMSVDATAGRVALSMRGLQAAGSAEVDGDEDDTGAFEDEEFDVGGEEEVEMDDDDSLDMLEPGEGMEFVAADEEPDIIFEMAEDDPEMTMEAVAAFEALEPEQISREVIRDVMPVPMGELISGKVSRIEEYGMFIEFDYGSRKRSGLLVPDEAKVPSASLTPEELAELVEEGEPAPQYVEIEINGPLSQYYNIGDPVDAFVLAYDEQGKMSLTQFADWEVDQAAAQELDAEDLPPNFQEERDPLSVDPFSWVDDDDTAATEEETEEATDEAFDKLSGANGLTASELREEVAGTGFSRPLFNQDVTMTFPSRPLNRVDATRLNVPLFKDEDQEGDIVELQDLWQETFHVPKKVHKALGLRFKYNEAGEPELVDKEGAEAQELSFEEAISGSHDDRVAAFVKDLLDDDEDEAEVPVLAMRRPVVLAAAVQNISAAVVKELRIKTGAGMMDCKKALAENDSDMDKAIEWLRKKGLAGADKKSGRVAAEGAIAAYIHPGSRLGVLLEVNCETDFVAAGDKFQSLVSELGMVAASCPDVVCVSADEVPAEVLAKEREVEMGKEDLKSKPEAVRAKIVEGRLQKARDNMSLLNQASLRDPTKTVSDIIKESIAAIGENIQVRRFVRFNLGEGLEKRSNDFAAEVAQQTQAKAAAPAPPKPAEAAAPAPAAPAAAKPAVQVAASVVKELREKTGAGMMDCKRALAENAGDMEASVEWLRKKGLAGADKKAGRVAAEGAITAYIHPGSRLGVLLEVNCETDFVAASEKFNALASSIAMQIAASPGVQYVSAEDIPAEVFAREKEIEMGREDLKNKPDAIRAKIAEGRVAKLGQEMALLPQPYLMDPSKTVEQAVKEAVATIGEKISVRRFIKFQLGEGIEKKSADFAAEVAAVTGAK
ncbi:polyprotein of PSRP-7 and EF-Ts, imported to chloroplast [Haematococcus lacustris]